MVKDGGEREVGLAPRRRVATFGERINTTEEGGVKCRDRYGKEQKPGMPLNWPTHSAERCLLFGKREGKKATRICTGAGKKNNRRKAVFYPCPLGTRGKNFYRQTRERRENLTAGRRKGKRKEKGSILPETWSKDRRGIRRIGSGLPMGKRK